MRTAKTKATIAISLTDLELLIRRVVREELARGARAPARAVLDDWSQEGPEDPAGDKELLREALVLLKKYKDKPETWTKWEDLEAELDRAEAKGELSN